MAELVREQRDEEENAAARRPRTASTGSRYRNV